MKKPASTFAPKCFNHPATKYAKIYPQNNSETHRAGFPAPQGIYERNENPGNLALWY